MSRILPILVGSIIVLATGLVHGLWTDRWQKAVALEDATARLERLPERIGPWKGLPMEDVDRASLIDAGAEGWWLRRFKHQRTGQVIDVYLLCGRAGRMSVHRPEQCFRGAGYDMKDSPARYVLAASQDTIPAALWTARFHKQTPTGRAELRVFWSWFAAGSWQAPEAPRLTFARYPVLYKLYLVRDLTTAQPDRLDDDPCVPFLRQLLPILGTALVPQ
jgi:hypothetical protein